MTADSRGNPALTPQELAAVVAAVELVWPVASPSAPEAPPRMAIREAPAWRFSGRWWA